MKTVLQKIYTLLPLVVVVFFFQNCGSQNKLTASTGSQSSYQGIADVDPAKLK